MIALLLLFFGILLVAIPFVLIPIMHFLTRISDEQYKCVSLFYELSPKLVSDERLPQSLADILKLISDDIDNSRVVRLLLRAWLCGKLRMYNSRGEDSFEQAISSLPPDLKNKFLAALATGLVAITYSSPLVGSVLRRLLFRPNGIPDCNENAPRFAYAMSLCS
jgi:hypothetical protein